MVRLTVRQRSLPDLVKEANKRLMLIEACAEGDWGAIEDAAIWLAQLLSTRPDAQPDWDAHSIGAKRYDRLKLSRRAPGTPSQDSINKENQRR